MGDRPTLYFAGPLFTQAEWQWNRQIADALRKKGLSVALPQENSSEMLRKQEPFDPQFLFEANRHCIERADIVLAVLDQPDVDSGTAWECGYAYKLGRPIIGLRTDIRAGGDDAAAGVNLMLARSCAKVITAYSGHREHPDRRIVNT